MARIEDELQRRGTAQRKGTARSYLIRLDAILPVIHLVHRRRGALVLADRMIVDHELILVERGAGELLLAGRAMSYREGAVLAIPPFIPHAFQAPAGNGSHVAVHFDPAPRIPAPPAGLGTRQPYTIRFPRGATLRPVTNPSVAAAVAPRFHDILAHWVRGGEAGLALARANLVVALVHLLSPGGPRRATVTGGRASRTRMLVERAARRMEERLHERITMTDVARWSGLSQTHFNRAFRHWTGLAPHAWLLQLRIEQARRLLGDPTLSIKQVAARAGFGDPLHFSKAFRAAAGAPPTRYREMLVAGRR